MTMIQLFLYQHILELNLGMMVTASCRGFHSALYGRGRAPIYAGEALFAPMLPNRLSFPELDIVYRTYLLTDTAAVAAAAGIKSPVPLIEHCRRGSVNDALIKAF
jgi:hypothetical protein